MMIAWLVIFLHAVIPHNHHDQQQPDCQSICHHQNSNITKESEVKKSMVSVLKPMAEKHESQICHFSTDLKHETSPDTFFFNADVVFIIHPATRIISTKNIYDQWAATDHQFRLKPLRAPPLA